MAANASPKVRGEICEEFAPAAGLLGVFKARSVALHALVFLATSETGPIMPALHMLSSAPESEPTLEPLMLRLKFRGNVGDIDGVLL